MKGVLIAITVLIGLATAAIAGDERLAPPKWTTGQSWKVKLLAWDKREMITGIPRQEPRYYEVAVYRFEVLESGPTGARLRLSLHTSKTIGPGRDWSAILRFDGPTLRLSKIAFFKGKEEKEPAQEAAYEDPVVFDPSESRLFGFPFEWPDFSRFQVTREPLRIELKQGFAILQEVSKDEKEFEIGWRRAGKRYARFRITQRWKNGDPWWSTIDRGDWRAELVRE